MKIITFSAIKGGVGKTTITYNYAEWLSKKGKNVLLIDLDHQCNLTNIYLPVEKNNTIGEVFKDSSIASEVVVHKIKNNLSLISGYIELDDLEKMIENQSKKEMLLYLWIKKNYKKFNFDQYDYILIDTHPDFSTITKNAIAISDIIISPITPSEHGYSAKFNLETRLEKFKNDIIDYSTGESYIDANLYFVGNLIKHNTKSSRELLEHIQKDETVIGLIPEKELFNRATLEKKSISEMKENQAVYIKNKSFFNSIDETFLKISSL
ncbi:ParA family protein [Lactococcus raffinolactis]|jgi:chromosome partitioning protein|uniref:AAA family ATPase n=1 Tax=Pseudolactococcus raffinolactis TaxID=1366 RepID=A0A6H0UFQ5_9LACT|nr:AAA family ATPase [Lactococcus raffinolactis]MBW9331839.1 ParA family protein [Lactococcus raffinolactis]QIW55020.1 AAA family ATPase [Lactococcus raffinolactis]